MPNARKKRISIFRYYESKSHKGLMLSIGILFTCCELMKITPIYCSSIPCRIHVQRITNRTRVLEEVRDYELELQNGCF